MNSIKIVGTTGVINASTVFMGIKSVQCILISTVAKTTWTNPYRHQLKSTLSLYIHLSSNVSVFQEFWIF